MTNKIKNPNNKNPKIHYEVAPDNRLVVTSSERKTSLPRYRRVVDGRFRVTADNTLTYLIRSPQDIPSGTPHEIRLIGTWSLSKGHDLKFTLSKSGLSVSHDVLLISGSVIDAGKNSIKFAVTTKYADGIKNTYSLDLAGVWQSDSRNRLTFRIDKGFGAPDILTFEGGWEVNKLNELIYRYEHREGKYRAGAIRTIVFRGRWDITDTASLTYVLDAATNSAFNFRTGMGVFKKDRVQYEVGMGYSNKLRPRVKTVIIYGRWKIGIGSGLSFEIETARGRLYSISFAAEVSVTAKDDFLFKLKTGADMRDMGVSVELSRKMLGGEGEAFLRYVRNHEEGSVLIGATGRW